MSDAKTPEEHKKKLVRAKVNNAIRDGRMKKPKNCQICHKPCDHCNFIMKIINQVNLLHEKEIYQKDVLSVHHVIRNLQLIIKEKSLNRKYYGNI